MKQRTTKINVDIVRIGSRILAYVVMLFVFGYGSVACVHNGSKNERDDKNQGKEIVMFERITMYGEAPADEYIALEGINSIVIEARHKGFIDDLRVYFRWESGLTVGEVFERIGRSDGRAYLIRLIRGEEIIDSGAGSLERHRQRDWELKPGDVIWLNEEIF
jgi:hypothetical protein